VGVAQHISTRKSCGHGGFWHMYGHRVTGSLEVWSQYPQAVFGQLQL